MHDFLAYIDNYNKGDTTNGNGFWKLYTLHKSGESNTFADRLGDFDNVDMDTLITFLNMSMPTISVSTYRDSITYAPFSNIVNKVEEAFALFVMENSFNNWFYKAELHQRKIHKVEFKDGDVDILEGTALPKVLYQEKRQMRKDSVYSAGKFTNEGLERFNTILMNVMQRCNNKSSNFDDKLMLYYQDNITDEAKDQIKRRNQSIKGEKEPKKRKVFVIDCLDV